MTSLFSLSPAHCSCPSQGPRRWGSHGARRAVLQPGCWAAPPSLFLLPPPALTHCLTSHLPGAGAHSQSPARHQSIYKSTKVQAPASCLDATCHCMMLGGLGKLAAEGLAHRTEKATEEAGKDPRPLSTWATLGLGDRAQT